MPPATVAAPSTVGVPETGVCGTGTGVAVTTCWTTGLGVAVTTTAGQLQEYSETHWGFLQRLTPSTVAHIVPLLQSPSDPHDASQLPGSLGVLVGTGVSVGVIVGMIVRVGVTVLVGVGVLVSVGVGVFLVRHRHSGQS